MTAIWEKTDQAGQAPWAVMVLVSIAIHLGGFGLAVGLPRLVPRRASGPPVYVVDLVSLPAGPPAARPAPAAPAAPARPEKPLKIPEREAKKPEPKKPKEAARPPEPAPKKPAAKTEPAATAAEAPPAASTPSPPATGAAGAAGPAGAVAGGAGGTGGRAADEYTFYLSLLDRRIRGAWKKPIFPLGDPRTTPFEARVRVTLTSSGRVVGIDLMGASGYDALDRSALRAVQEAQPFPPFPYQIGVDSLSVDFEFVLKPGEE